MKKFKTSAKLTPEEINEIRLAQQTVAHKKIELILIQNGLQNILRNLCKKYNLNEDTTAYNLETGTLIKGK